MEEKREEENKKTQSSSFAFPYVDGIIEVVGEGVNIVSSPVVDFLKDKFNLVGDAASEVATKLPQTVIEQIEKFDGENLNNIVSSVADTIKSIEFPDIDFPDLDF